MPTDDVLGDDVLRWAVSLEFDGLGPHAGHLAGGQKDEARALFGLVERGSSTAEAVRELIEVSPADEQRLRRIAEAEPEVAHCVLPVLRFRRRVLREFERMVAQPPYTRLAVGISFPLDRDNRVAL